MESHEIGLFFSDLATNTNMKLMNAMQCLETEMKNLNVIPEDRIKKGILTLTKNVEFSMEKSMDSIELFAKDNIFKGVDDAPTSKTPPVQMEVMHVPKEAKELMIGNITKEIDSYGIKRQEYLEKQVLRTIHGKQEAILRNLQNEQEIPAFKNKLEQTNVTRQKMKETLGIAKKKQDEFNKYWGL